MFNFLKKKEKKKELTPAEKLEAASKYLETGEVTEGMDKVVVKKKQVSCRITLADSEKTVDLYCDDLPVETKYTDPKAFGNLLDWFDHSATETYMENYDNELGGYRLVRSAIQFIDFLEEIYDAEVKPNGMG